MTRSLSRNGYRIQTRAAVYFIKTLWSFITFISFFPTLIVYPNWFKAHFIDLKAESNDFPLLLHITATFVAFYSWEVITNRYAKMNWSTIVHHWATVITSMSILMGRYTPFAVWYGFTGLSMIFPIWFMLGFRAQYSFRYPEFTRKGFVFAYWWYIFCNILNFSGQIFLITNSLYYHYNESIPVSSILIMCVIILCLLYDDIILLRSLQTFSMQEYEEADFLSTAIDSKVCATAQVCP